ncbi:hypothetical protein LG71_03415 [Pluralibacter gergoviae]|uniref:hypothetical protein n=1 Tax=Pluralibacter gergoviae TaxID=61647 RepID=UPI0004F805C3|nr:hypothetical protein [Pluralibacter gergoviae]AIQ99012.1 hypothetical protein LG71_03415 [Pluralibacter gergoviae]
MGVKIRLPEREFYTLIHAADILGCEYNDVIHFAQTKGLPLSAYIEPFDNSDGELTLSSYQLFEGDFLHSDIFTINALQRVESNLMQNSDGATLYNYSFESLSGVFYINPLNLLELEFDDAVEDVVTMFIAPRPPSEKEFIYIANSLEQAVKIKRKNLCVHRDDLCSFQNEPVPLFNMAINIPEAIPRVTVHQFKMMYALLKISGLTDNEIYEISPAELNTKLGQVGAKLGVSVPQPDKATWVKWREKFR